MHWTSCYTMPEGVCAKEDAFYFYREIAPLGEKTPFAVSTVHNACTDIEIAAKESTCLNVGYVGDHSSRRSGVDHVSTSPKPTCSDNPHP